MALLSNPPVVEVVLGVQFVTLPRITSSHYGVFWAKYLDANEWPEATDAGPLPEQFEMFDARPAWGQPQVRLMLAPPEAPRVMFRSADEERVIQIQPNRFLYNWRRRTQGYPSYDRVREGFERYFGSFEKMVGDRKLGELLLNQWEVTYVDRIPAGDLWQRPADWHRVIPGLIPPPPRGVTVALDGVNGEWHYEMPDRRGRVHVAVGQGTPEKQGGEPPLVITTTVRGPIGEAGTADWQTGIELGHAAAGEIFFAVTSAAAQTAWGKSS